MKFGSYLQPNWDWRAAGNFMFGGTGSAMMLMTALTTWPDAPPLPLGLAALGFVGLGLFLVWLEIGRPWRFLNVFFHPQASWMTREASIAVLLFGAALAGVALQSAVIIACAGVLGLVFLYCQGRILKGSKGIPAWREPAVMPLILSTGLTEGTSMLVLVLILFDSLPAGLAFTLLVFAVLRTWAWFHYREALQRAQAPAGTQQQFKNLHGWFVAGGNVIPIVLAATFAFGGHDWMILLAALLALFAGWHMKFVLVAKAAFVQGYGIGTMHRGRPTPRKPVRRQGDPWQT